MLFNESMSLGEKFVNSIAITILGMLVVFSVLIIISYSLDLLRILFSKESEKKNTPNEIKPVTQSAAVAATNDEDDIELLVIITAAIAAETETSADSIIVRSITPILQKSNMWATAGRQHQMLERL